MAEPRDQIETHGLKRAPAPPHSWIASRNATSIYRQAFVFEDAVCHEYARLEKLFQFKTTAASGERLVGVDELRSTFGRFITPHDWRSREPVPAEYLEANGINLILLSKYARTRLSNGRWQYDLDAVVKFDPTD